MSKAVFGIAQNVKQAELIVDRLKTAGFSNNDISVLLPDKSGTKDFAHEKHTKAPEGAAIGGSTGMGLGAALGWLAGIGSLAIPGVGPFIAAGPIVERGSRRRRSRQSHRCLGGLGHSGIRGQTIRREAQGGRSPDIRTHGGLGDTVKSERDFRGG